MQFMHGAARASRPLWRAHPFAAPIVCDFFDFWVSLKHEPGFLTTLCRFGLGGRKGGALAPPLERLLPTFGLAARTVRRLTDCAGGET
jgi:hypothetical protein